MEPTCLVGQRLFQWSPLQCLQGLGGLTAGLGLNLGLCLLEAAAATKPTAVSLPDDAALESSSVTNGEISWTGESFLGLLTEMVVQVSWTECVQVNGECLELLESSQVLLLGLAKEVRCPPAKCKGKYFSMTLRVA